MDLGERQEPSPPVQTGRETVRLLLAHVRQHRLNRNWSQAEIARRACLSRSAYQNFENGCGNLTLANLVGILDVLGLAENLAQLVPPVTAEATPAAPPRLPRLRARSRPAAQSQPDLPQ